MIRLIHDEPDLFSDLPPGEAESAGVMKDPRQRSYVACSDRDLLQLMIRGFLVAGGGEEYPGRFIGTSFETVRLPDGDLCWPAAPVPGSYHPVLLEMSDEFSSEELILPASAVHCVIFPAEEAHRSFMGTYLAGDAPFLHPFEVRYEEVKEGLPGTGEPRPVTELTKAEQDSRARVSCFLEILGGGIYALIDVSSHLPVCPDVVCDLLRFVHSWRPDRSSSPEDLLTGTFLALSGARSSDRQNHDGDMAPLLNVLASVISKHCGERPGNRQLFDEISHGLNDGDPQFVDDLRGVLEGDLVLGPGHFRDVPDGHLFRRAIAVLLLDPDVERMGGLFAQDEKDRPGRIVHSMALFLGGCLRGCSLVSKTRISRPVMLEVSGHLVTLGQRMLAEVGATKSGKIIRADEADGRVEIVSGTTVLTCQKPVRHPFIEKLAVLLADQGQEFEFDGAFGMRMKGSALGPLVDRMDSDLPDSIELQVTRSRGLLREDHAILSTVWSSSSKNWNNHTRQQFLRWLGGGGNQWPIQLVPLMTSRRVKIMVRVPLIHPSPESLGWTSRQLLGALARLDSIQWRGWLLGALAKLESIHWRD